MTYFIGREISLTISLVNSPQYSHFKPGHEPFRVLKLACSLYVPNGIMTSHVNERVIFCTKKLVQNNDFLQKKNW